MSRTANQKLKLLYLMKLFMEKTDEEHPLTVPELISLLRGYGVECERKSVYDDLEALRQFGLDIEVRRTKTHSYYLASREFELPELKLLADAVACSRFITRRKSEELIAKISGLASTHQAGRLRRQVYVTGRVKSPNERIYYNVDTIHEAIADNRQISFRYFDYTADKTKRYRRDGGAYLLSPLSLCWDDENYYLIAYYPKYNHILHFRVDKMEQITVLDQPRDTLPPQLHFDPASYTRTVFGMFGGEEEMVRLELDERLVGVVLDRFGSDLLIRPAGEGRVITDVKVAVSPQFLAWVFGLEQGARILAPARVVDEMHRRLSAALDLYPPAAT